MNELVQIKNLIYEIRGYKVMLDSDLADLYEIETKRLNEAVNILILVDSCNVIANETQQILDEIFSKTVFE